MKVIRRAIDVNKTGVNVREVRKTRGGYILIAARNGEGEDLERELKRKVTGIMVESRKADKGK